MTPAQAIESAGLSVTAVFVPFSQSRNADNSHKSLNWKVSLYREGRSAPILTTDYSAGIAHCPGYKPRQGDIRSNYERHGDTRSNYERDDRVNDECKTGKAYKTGAAILPDPADVIYSLIRDADVLDAGGFESWASDLGYDTDSRKAEAIYRQCLETALAMRVALGESTLAQLREAFQDY